MYGALAVDAAPPVIQSMTESFADPSSAPANEAQAQLLRAALGDAESLTNDVENDMAKDTSQ